MSRTMREFECGVVHEMVKISLRTKRSIGLKARDTLVVQCDQHDCQYSEENKSPCPLSLAMFDKEIQERQEKARQRREDAQYH